MNVMIFHPICHIWSWIDCKDRLSVGMFELEKFAEQIESTFTTNRANRANWSSICRANRENIMNKQINICPLRSNRTNTYSFIHNIWPICLRFVKYESRRKEMNRVNHESNQFGLVIFPICEAEYHEYLRIGQIKMPDSPNSLIVRWTKIQIPTVQHKRGRVITSIAVTSIRS